MKRFHVHVNVDELSRSIRFYSTLFGVAPTLIQSDYAKWMLDDPRVNFAISQRGRQAGIDHLGFQAEEASELSAMGERLQAADAVVLTEKSTPCCYARSDKFWAVDPQGVRWESFYTHGEATLYANTAEQSEAAACCGPQWESATGHCGQQIANCGC